MKLFKTSNYEIICECRNYLCFCLRQSGTGRTLAFLALDRDLFKSCKNIVAITDRVASDTVDSWVDWVKWWWMRGCFQVEGVSDVTAWTTAIHTACAASLARHLNRDSAIRLLQSKMRQLEISVDLVRHITHLYMIIYTPVLASRSNPGMACSASAWKFSSSSVLYNERIISVGTCSPCYKCKLWLANKNLNSRVFCYSVIFTHLWSTPVCSVFYFYLLVNILYQKYPQVGWRRPDLWYQMCAHGG